MVIFQFAMLVYQRVDHFGKESMGFPHLCYLGLFKMIFYFPNGKSTMTGESIVNIFYFLGTP